MKYLVLVLSLIFLLQHGSKSQVTYVTSDLETWSSISAEKKFDDFKISLEQQLRLKQNSAVMHNTFTELGLAYKFSKSFSVIGKYRYIFDKDYSDFERYRRINVYAKYKVEINRLEASFRAGYQHKKEKGLPKEVEAYYARGFRFKLGLNYNIPNWKWDPIFSTEIFNTKEEGGLSDWNKIRFTLGTERKFLKDFVIKPFYRFEREFTLPFNKSTYILGVNLTYKF